MSLAEWKGRSDIIFGQNRRVSGLQFYQILQSYAFSDWHIHQIKKIFASKKKTNPICEYLLNEDLTSLSHECIRQASTPISAILADWVVNPEAERDLRVNRHHYGHILPDLLIQAISGRIIKNPLRFRKENIKAYVDWMLNFPAETRTALFERQEAIPPIPGGRKPTLQYRKQCEKAFLQSTQISFDEFEPVLNCPFDKPLHHMCILMKEYVTAITKFGQPLDPIPNNPPQPDPAPDSTDLFPDC